MPFDTDNEGNLYLLDFGDNFFSGPGAGGIFRLSPVLPGDFNSDGQVDVADYTLWRDSLGATCTQGDYLTWRNHNGETTGTSAELPTPEPGALVLLLAGATSAALRKPQGCQPDEQQGRGRLRRRVQGP